MNAHTRSSTSLSNLLPSVDVAMRCLERNGAINFSAAATTEPDDGYHCGREYIALPLPESGAIHEVVHISDVHIPFFRQASSFTTSWRRQQYAIVIDRVIKSVWETPEVRGGHAVVVVTGDVFDCKHSANAETVDLFHRFIIGLCTGDTGDQIKRRVYEGGRDNGGERDGPLLPVYVTPGNHDIHLEDQQQDGVERAASFAGDRVLDLLDVLIAPLSERLPVRYMNETGMYGTRGSGVVFGLLHIRDMMAPGNCSGALRPLEDVPFHLLDLSNDTREAPSTHEGRRTDAKVFLYHGQVASHRSLSAHGQFIDHGGRTSNPPLPEIAASLGFDVCMFGDVHTMQLHNMREVKQTPGAVSAEHDATSRDATLREQPSCCVVGVFTWKSREEGGEAANDAKQPQRVKIKGNKRHEPALSSEANERTAAWSCCPWAYAGSMLQLNAGERVFPHGFLAWRPRDKTVTAVHVCNPFGTLFCSEADDFDRVFVHNAVAPLCDEGVPEPLELSSREDVGNAASLSFCAARAWLPRFAILRLVGVAGVVTHACWESFRRNLWERHGIRVLGENRGLISGSSGSRHAGGDDRDDAKRANSGSGGGRCGRDAAAVSLDLSRFGSPDTWVDYLHETVGDTHHPEWETWLRCPETMQITTTTSSSAPSLPDFLSAKIRDRNLKISKKCSECASSRSAPANGSDSGAAAPSAAASQKSSSRTSFALRTMRWSWLLCYGPDNVFDFGKMDGRVLLLSAPNGHGKSAMLEILCLSLFGQAMPSRGGKTASPDCLNRSKPADGGRQPASCSIDVVVSRDDADAFPAGTNRLSDDAIASEEGRPSTSTLRADGAQSHLLLHHRRSSETFRIARTYTVSPTTGKLVSTARVSKVVPPHSTLVTVKDGTAAVNAWTTAHLGKLESFLLCSLLTQSGDADFFGMKPVDQRALLDEALALDAAKAMCDVIKEARLAHAAVLDAILTIIDATAASAVEAVAPISRFGAHDADATAARTHVERVTDMERFVVETLAAVDRSEREAVRDASSAAGVKDAIRVKYEALKTRLITASGDASSISERIAELEAPVAPLPTDDEGDDDFGGLPEMTGRDINRMSRAFEETWRTTVDAVATATAQKKGEETRDQDADSFGTPRTQDEERERRLRRLDACRADLRIAEEAKEALDNETSRLRKCLQEMKAASKEYDDAETEDDDVFRDERKAGVDINEEIEAVDVALRTARDCVDVSRRKLASMHADAKYSDALLFATDFIDDPNAEGSGSAHARDRDRLQALYDDAKNQLAEAKSLRSRNEVAEKEAARVLCCVRRAVSASAEDVYAFGVSERRPPAPANPAFDVELAEWKNLRASMIEEACRRRFVSERESSGGVKETTEEDAEEKAERTLAAVCSRRDEVKNVLHRYTRFAADRYLLFENARAASEWRDGGGADGVTPLDSTNDENDETSSSSFNPACSVCVRRKRAFSSATSIAAGHEQSDDETAPRRSSLLSAAEAQVKAVHEWYAEFDVQDSIASDGGSDSVDDDTAACSKLCSVLAAMDRWMRVWRASSLSASCGSRGMLAAWRSDAEKRELQRAWSKCAEARRLREDSDRASVSARASKHAYQHASAESQKRQQESDERNALRREFEDTRAELRRHEAVVNDLTRRLRRKRRSKEAAQITRVMDDVGRRQKKADEDVTRLRDAVQEENDSGKKREEFETRAKSAHDIVSKRQAWTRWQDRAYGCMSRCFRRLRAAETAAEKADATCREATYEAYRARTSADAFYDAAAKLDLLKGHRDVIDARKRDLERLYVIMGGFTSWVYTHRAIPALVGEVNALLTTMCADLRLDGACRSDDGDSKASVGGGAAVLSWALNGSPLQKSSGMQRFAASLAMRIALSQLGASASTCEQLIIDEGFVTLDAHNMSFVPDFLHESIIETGRFASVLLVSHLEGVREAADAVVPIFTKPASRPADNVEADDRGARTNNNTGVHGRHKTTDRVSILRYF